MKALKEERPRSAKIVPFCTPMGKAAPKTSPTPPPAPSPPSFWQRHGTTAQVVAASCGVGALVVSLTIGSFTVIWHYSTAESAHTDEHTNALIEEKLKPVNQQLQHLSEQVSDALGQLKRMDGQIRESELRQRGPNLLVQANSPNQLLAGIRVNLEKALKQDRKLPETELIEYRKKVLTTPTSREDYWSTVAAIINDQSFLNQLENKAPDPSKVVRECAMLTGGQGSYNLMQGVPISHCIVDLDSTHNELDNLTIQDSVVRYHGGPVAMKNVVFINCRFILDLKDFPQKPARPDLLLSLLASDQTRVTLSAAG